MKVYEVRYMAEKIAKAINDADLRQTTGIIAEFYNRNEEIQSLFKIFLYQELQEIGWTKENLKRVEIRGCYISLRI